MLAHPHRRTCRKTLLVRRVAARRSYLALAARSDDVTLRELRAMFGQAAPRWEPPDEKTLADCPYLLSVAWVPRWVAQSEAPWESAEREVWRALRTLEAELPALVETYQRLAVLRPLGRARAVTLTGLNGLVPIAMAALRPHQRNGTADWHGAAALIAAQAKEAWGKLDGRRSAPTRRARLSPSFTSSLSGQASRRITGPSPTH